MELCKGGGEGKRNEVQHLMLRGSFRGLICDIKSIVNVLLLCIAAKLENGILCLCSS